MSRILDSLPKQDGFRMPGEFEPHAGTWMLWPERPDNWRLGAKPAQRVFADVARAISRFELVTMGVSVSQFQNARHQLPGQLRVVEISCNDSWMRDCGPIFVTNEAGEVRVVNWKFNAWGGLFDGLYFPWDLDEQVPEKVAEIERLDRYDAPMVLEGGAFNVDGEGTLLTTEECLLSPGRNPDLSKGEIEALLSGYLNVEQIIWLEKGLDPLETNGHVDGLCCFARPGVVVMHWTEDQEDPHYDIVHDAFERLIGAKDARGRRLEVHKLLGASGEPMTGEESRGVDVVRGTAPRREGDEVDASYINFYLVNGGVIVPSYGHVRDGLAVEMLAKVFPGRKVVGIPDAREIALGGGNVHCITQQQPEGSGPASR